MPTWVPISVVVVGTAHLIAYYSGRRALAGALKALPILLLAGFAATANPSVGRTYATLVAAGLLCSAVGDVCLVWPERFTAGLASFLVGHCCYVAAFATGALGGMAAPWLVGIGLVTAGLLAVLWPHLGRVRGPVLVYVTVIAAMAWMAARRALAPDTPVPSGELARAGALAFMASDGVLALDRFVRRFGAAHAVVMVTYYAAQTLIAASVAAFP
jgi:uncharacterized membrane protein YhhN